MSSRGMEISDIGYAIKLYYSKIELGNKEIKELFNIKSDATALRIKKNVMEEMTKKDIKKPVFDRNKINTKVAFEVWGIDIAELEKMYSKLAKYGFI